MQNSGTKHKSKAVQNLLDKFKDAGNSADKGAFKFPPPPIVHESRLSPVCNSDTSDSQADSLREKKISSAAKTNNRGCRTDSESDKLPPIGVFWDIENCQIPHGKSALTIVQAIRNTFFEEYREAEFTVVCDVHKESPIIIQELNDAQVDLLHVISSSKNAADEKLRQAIRRFADLHGTPSTVVLISSDINFAPDLSDLRHRKKIHVILLHATNCSESLIMCANEHYNFAEFVQPLPTRNQQVVDTPQSADIFVWNLPMTQGDQRIRWRLKTLSQNCGGRIIVISRPMAVLRFPTLEMAMRAQKRMDGELVFGHSIRVGVSHFLDPPITSRYDNTYVPLSRSRSGNSISFSANGGQSLREPNQSSFLPINPNPWIFQNGTSSQFLSDFHNKPSKPYEDSVPNGAPTSDGFSQSPWAWNIKEEDKNDLPKSSQTMLNGFSKLSVSNGGGGVGNSQMVGNTENHSRFSYPCNGSSNVQKGWKNATPTFTTAFVDPRDWADSSSKNRRTSPINNNTPAHARRKNSGEPGWNSAKSSGNRKCRTPSPYMLNSSKMAHPLAVKPTGLNSAIPSKEGFESKEKHSPSSPTCSSVELHVTNLDQTYDPLEMKKMLTGLFNQHVMEGVHVSVFVQADQTFAASVKVPSLQDAQLIISRFHRRKLGFRKIYIAYAHPTQQQDFQYLRWQTISLLQDVPQHMLPLFKFLEMFESRYVTPVSMTDIFKLSDVCTISDESGGRMISLNPEFRDVVSPIFQTIQEIPPYCAKHYVLYQPNSKGWAELEARPFPNVMLPLPIFSSNIKKLLASHGNVLPLSSLIDCYNAECNPLEVADHGVPLEHYVTCVNQVELVTDSSGIKYLRPGVAKNPIEEVPDESPSVSPSLASALKQFEKEAVDLMKVQPHCQLLFNKFIPAYHHHFGRQCRVADYGYTKLIELLEAIPHVIQVMGECNKRIVTLSHRAQIRRFTSDLIRALRTQPVKRMSLAELPAVFERVLGRTFDTVDYGLCTLNDLVNLLSDSNVFVNQEGVLSIPQRKRTEIEEKRTKQFSQEVIELLSHMPKFSIDFDKFIPAYHHHFSQQCRVSEFGFTKLVELFEAIPDTVKLEDDSEGRKLTLTSDKKIQVLSEQMIDLVYPACPPGLHLNNLETRYLWHYGYVLNPALYNAANLEELVTQLDSVKIVKTEQGKVVVPLEGALLKQITTKVRAFLINSESGRMPLAKLRSHFSVYHEPHLTPQKLLKNMPEVVQLDEEDGVIVIELTPVFQLIRQLVRLVVKSEGRLQMATLEEAYEKEFGAALDLTPYRYASVEDLMLDATNIFVIRGKGLRRQVRLNKEIITSLRKPLNSGTFSGAAICRPPSACSISDTSIATSGDESTGKSPTPMVTLPELSVPNFQNNNSEMYSPCKGLLLAQSQADSYSSPPDPSELPQPVMHLVSEPEKEIEVQSAFNPAYPDLFSNRPGSVCSSHSGNDSATPGSSGQKRRVRLAAQFNQPLKR